MINQIAHEIKRHRKKAGLTQIELAKLANVGKTVIYDLEHRKNTIQLKTLLCVFDVLNIKIVLESPLIQVESKTR